MRLSVLAALFLTLAAACQPTPEKIETWKGTKHGPQKLRMVVKDGGADPKLRALAAAALAELGMIQEATRDLAAAEPRARTLAANELASVLETALGESLTGPTATTARQRAAKDLLFVVRGDADPAHREQIDAALVRWTTRDLAARASQGGESSEKILRAIGPAAAAAVMESCLPGPNLALCAKLIGDLGDPKAQEAVAARLGALAASRPHDELLAAIGLVGGPTATSALLQLVERGKGDVRVKALYALGQGKLSAGDARAQKAALAVAADAGAPGEVREAGFQVLEKLGPAAVGDLLGLFTDKSETVRFRAVEAALKAGGVEAIPRVLDALPADRPIKLEDLDSFVVHDLTLLDGKQAPAPLARYAADASKRPHARLAALRALAKVGTPAEATAVRSMLEGCASATPVTPALRLCDEAKRTEAALAARR